VLALATSLETGAAAAQGGVRSHGRRPGARRRRARHRPGGSRAAAEHDLSEVREVGGVLFRTCKPDEEEQATAFGGTLLLPRPLLMRAALRGETPPEIADACGVTVEMARYRYNTTGVARQAQRRSG